MPNYKKWIEEGCLRLGISQAELGRRIGADRQTINNLKRRNRMEAERFKSILAIIGPPPTIPASAPSPWGLGRLRSWAVLGSYGLTSNGAHGAQPSSRQHYTIRGFQRLPKSPTRWKASAKS